MAAFCVFCDCGGRDCKFVCKACKIHHWTSDPVLGLVHSCCCRPPVMFVVGCWNGCDYPWTRQVEEAAGALPVLPKVRGLQGLKRYLCRLLGRV